MDVIESTGDREQIRLNPELVSVDYWDYLDSIQRQDTTPDQRAQTYLRELDRYRGELAENIDADWIIPRREKTPREIVKTAINLAAELVEHDQLETGITLLHKAQTLQPQDALIYQRIIELEEQLGHHEAAAQTKKMRDTELARLGLTPEDTEM